MLQGMLEYMSKHSHRVTSQQKRLASGHYCGQVTQNAGAAESITLQSHVDTGCEIKCQNHGEDR